MMAIFKRYGIKLTGRVISTDGILLKIATADALWWVKEGEIIKFIEVEK